MWKLNHPTVQNLLASLIVALNPGIYAAITILGAGGGPPNATQAANISNSVLYGIYFIAGLFSGSVVTTLGPRYTFMIGTLGYPVFVGGLWYFTSTGNLWYPIFGGAVLGLTAVLLWTAAGFIAFSYPVEAKKASFISMQWGLLSLGSTFAGLVAFGINFNATVPQSPTAVYVVFICLMVSGGAVAFFGIVSPKDVKRQDGTPLLKYPHNGLRKEMLAQFGNLKDWRMLVLVVPMFASEVAVIVISTLNALYFNLRTRSLNSVMFSLMQAVGAFVITVLLDSERLGKRRTRGIISILVVGSICIAGWIGLVVWLYQNPLGPSGSPLWDWTDSEFGGFFVLNLIFGLNMVIYQVMVQWIIASLTNDPYQLARYAGLAKGCLAGGLACSFGLEAAQLSQLRVVTYNFTIQTVGLVCMLIVCCFSVKPTSEPEKGHEPESAADNAIDTLDAKV